MATIIEGGVLDPTTGVIDACPAINPWTGMQTNATCPRRHLRLANRKRNPMVGIEHFDTSEHPTYTEEGPNSLLG